VISVARLRQGEKILIGDPVKMAQAINASCKVKPAPRRLVLGSDAYRHIEAALVEGLALLRSQKELAFSTDLSSQGDDISPIIIGSTDVICVGSLGSPQGRGCYA
jgi:hypothetical protein